MAMPRRTDVDDYFDRLDPVARPHLDKLRELSRASAPGAREELQWNQPAYLLDSRLWMLQAFKQHASLRFPLRIVGAHKSEIEAAGFASGSGMIRLPYDKPLPVDLLNLLMKARFDEYESTGAGWSK
jgi:uncharacterized protein YdhG (YjbR/CyaY superfamily)